VGSIDFWDERRLRGWFRPCEFGGTGVLRIIGVGEAMLPTDEARLDVSAVLNCERIDGFNAEMDLTPLVGCLCRFEVSCCGRHEFESRAWVGDRLIHPDEVPSKLLPRLSLVSSGDIVMLFEKLWGSRSGVAPFGSSQGSSSAFAAIYDAYVHVLGRYPDSTAADFLRGLEENGRRAVPSLVQTLKSSDEFQARIR